MNKIITTTGTITTALILASTSIQAEEMDHSKHAMPPQMDHSGHDMSKHAGHDTGAVAHIHHSHGKGAWMFEYRNMTMEMDGLLRGSDSISTQAVSGVTPAPSGGTMCAPDGGAGASRLRLADGKISCMAPTTMTMNMNMFMLMYGLSDKVTLMGMANYLQNDMDMVMHMFRSDGTLNMTMTGDMETSGLGDVQLGGMYTMTNELTVSGNLSIPTGSTTESVSMSMLNPKTGMSRPAVNVRAPYGMQLGSGTYDILGAITLKDATDALGYGAQMTYTLRTGDNDEGYNLGDRYELMGWLKYAPSKTVLLTTRLNFINWDKIDGSDSEIKSHINTTNNPNNYGGNRLDLMLGVSGFYKNHMFGIEYGFPINQDLNGVQLETESILSVSYQNLW